MIKIIITEQTFDGHDINWLEFSSNDPSGNFKPEDIINFEEKIFSLIDPKKGTIISGRGPTWIFSWINHELHPGLWAADYVPREGYAVITQSHKAGLPAGSVIKID